MLAVLALCVALGSPVAIATSPGVPSPAGGVRVAAIATAEVLEPVTNDPRASRQAPLRVVSQTRDGRLFVEFQ